MLVRFLTKVSVFAKKLVYCNESFLNFEICSDDSNLVQFPYSHALPLDHHSLPQ